MSWILLEGSLFLVSAGISWTPESTKIHDECHGFSRKGHHFLVSAGMSWTPESTKSMTNVMDFVGGVIIFWFLPGCHGHLDVMDIQILLWIHVNIPCEPISSIPKMPCCFSIEPLMVRSWF